MTWQLNPRPPGRLAIRLGSPLGWAFDDGQKITSGSQKLLQVVGGHGREFTTLFIGWLDHLEFRWISEVLYEHRRTLDQAYLVGQRILNNYLRQIGVRLTTITPAQIKRAGVGPHATQRQIIRQARLRFNRDATLTYPEAAALWILDVCRESTQPSPRTM